MPLRGELRRALAFGREEREALELALAAAKAEVYEATLADLARRHGANPPELSSVILRELRDAAHREAVLMVSSYNRDLTRQLDKVDLADPRAALRRLEEWSHQRAERQAPVVAITGTYDAHADATVQFFRAAGVDPGFDFGGHGDDEPVCGICKVLVARSPHSLDAVIAIGVPHPQCRQDWHVAGPVELPDDYTPGQGGVAGIVGRSTLIQRAGDIEAAVQTVEAL